MHLKPAGSKHLYVTVFDEVVEEGTSILKTAEISAHTPDEGNEWLTLDVDSFHVPSD
jgi:hypothetical protein